MLVKFEDKEYNLDIDEITVSQARKIFKNTGLTLFKLQAGLRDVNPEAMVALYWLMKAQNGETVDMDRVEFKIVKFASAIGDAAEREEAENLHITVEELRAAQEEAQKKGVTVQEVLKGENPTDAPGDSTEDETEQ